MPSPSGIYTQFTTDQLDVLQAAAFTWLTTGRRIALSGGQKSGTKEYPGDPNTMLAEIKYARRKLGLIPARVGKVYSDYVNPPCPAMVNQEQT